MKQVSALLEQIRGYVNDVHLYEKHFHSNLDEWNALCVAMDTLRDTCEALDYYETHEWGEGIGEKYLKLY